MSVIIRLQNLPWSANALDIRQYFHGLSIPEGGVHIVGGELGDAFIAFSTDEDARQAFNMSHGRIKEVQIKLMLSSRTEMQKVIEAARNQSMAAFIGSPTPPAAPNIAPPTPVAPPAPSLSTPSQPTAQIPIAPPTPVQPPTLGRIRPLLPAMVPDVRESLADTNLQLQLQQLQQVQQQQTVTTKDSKDSGARDRRRSRSRSRERRDRNRRRRSRSRSRERRERRRRERSRERRSSSRDRRSRDISNRKSIDGKTNNSAPKSIGVWENPPPRMETNLLQNPATLQLLGSLLPNANLLNLDSTVASLLPAAFDPWAQVVLPDVPIPMNNSHQTINDSLQNRSANNDGDSESKSNNRERDRENREQRGRDRGGRERERDRDRGDNDRDHNRNRDRDQQQNDHVISLDGSNESVNNSRNKFEGGDGSRRVSRTNRMEDKNACVRLFPYYGGFGEIRRFFSGLFISNTGIKFALSPFNEQTGVVLVRFATFREKEQGIERNGQTLKGMEVQVTELSDEDFENAKDPDAIVNSLDLAFKNDPFTCLVLEDIPPFTTNHHLLKMFSDYSVVNIYIVQKQRAPPVGYIKFGSKEDAHKALVDKARHSVEGKRVRVGPCKEEVFEAIRKQQEGDQEQENDVKIESDGATAYILLNDVPQKSSDRDIADFFSDIGIVPTNIIMLRNDNGMYNGETFCEFFNADEARVAYQKKGMPMGNSTVNMTYVTKQFIEMNLKEPPNNGLAPNDILNNLNNHNLPRLPLISPLMVGPGGPGLLGMPSLPMLQRPFFPPRGGHRGMGMMGGPRGMMRMPRHPLNMHPRMNMRFPRMPHNMMQQQMPPQQSLLQQQYEDDEEIAPPGCTLLMENVPFKAELEELLDFFDGYDVSPDNVLRKYDVQGRPSGETKIIFNSPEEVFHVLQEKRGCKIRDRIVYLSQC